MGHRETEELMINRREIDVDGLLIDLQNAKTKLRAELEALKEFLIYNRKRMTEYGLTVVEIDDHIGRVTRTLDEIK